MLVTFVGQSLFKEYIVWPIIHYFVHTFQNYKNAIDIFIHLDYGRIVGRISGFIGVLLFYFLFLRFVDKVPIKNSVFFKKTGKLKFFLYGMILGTILVGITISITILSHTIIVSSKMHGVISLLQIIILYLIAQLISSTTEELILRGYILNRLAEIFNPNFSVIISSLIFGYMHLQVSFLYAGLAFLFGLIVGYVFIWTRNIYFCIGIHFSWNFIESIVYSQSIFNVNVIYPLLGGAKNITPDQEGLLSLPALLIGLILLVSFKNYLKINPDKIVNLK